jgi:ribosomal protein L29
LATSSVDNSRGIRNARRDVARIKTVLRERELEREQAK